MPGPAADDVDLAVDDAAERVVARHGHGPAALPLVRLRVVHLVSAENPRRSEEREERVLGPFRRRGAADHVDLAADFRGNRGPALAGQRRQRLPGIRRRVVLPRVVNRFPCAANWDGGVLRWDEAADHIDLAVRSGQGRMVRRPRHRRLLRPFVGDRVVFVGDAASLAPVPAAKHVEFAVGGNAVELLIGLREWCALLPGRCWHLRQRARDEHHAGHQHGKHGSSSFQYFRHERSPFEVVDDEAGCYRVAAVAGACEGAAAALVAAVVGGGAPNCSSRMSCIAVCVESVGSRNTSAPADCIIPLTR